MAELTTERVAEIKSLAEALRRHPNDGAMWIGFLLHELGLLLGERVEIFGLQCGMDGDTIDPRNWRAIAAMLEDAGRAARAKAGG
jgi:hypothetical protein